MTAPKSRSRSANLSPRAWAFLVSSISRRPTARSTATICILLVVARLTIVGLIGNPVWNSYTESAVMISNSSPLSALLQSPSAPNVKGPTDSIHVVNEKDIAKDYSNQTAFEGTFFDSTPECMPLTTDQVSFTLVTQASMDRLFSMKYHCQRWPPPLPISIAIYLPKDSPYDETHVSQELGVGLGCDLRRMKVTVLKGSSSMARYPVNLLRNLAIRSAKTSHVVYTDSDFLISDGLHENLMAVAPTVANDSLAAIVIPAFVYHSACPVDFSSKNDEASNCLANEQENMIPKTKEDLLKLWGKKRSDTPNVKPGFHGVHYHGSTRYAEYKNQTSLLSIPCIANYLYEPYLTVRLCNRLPEFPEVFRGYGWNKNIWIMWLTKKLSYRLFQLPRGFVVHLPHGKSASWLRIHKPNPTSSWGKKEKGKAPPEHEHYLDWFKKMVPNHPNRMPSCEDRKKG